MFKKEYFYEEGFKIPKHSGFISRKLDVFYNPEMKINRDVSLLVIDSYFKNKKIVFCDPMCASGIREIRFIKILRPKFEKLVCGDISARAISQFKENLRINKVTKRQIELHEQNAINTLALYYYDFIEIDPFGSPVPFIDLAIQRMKHNGILSVTATDTAALCGTYPKTCKRRYGIKVEKNVFYEELGLRNLIAYVQRQGAKYERKLTPIVSFTNKHFFKIFFKVEESRQEALDTINALRYFKWDKKSQEIKLSEYEEKGFLGKTYVGPLNDKDLLLKMKEKISLIEESKEIRKLLDSLIEEIDIFGYYETHKLMKENKFNSSIKTEDLIKEIKRKKKKVSRTHNSNFGIKSNISSKELIKIMRRFK